VRGPSAHNHARALAGVLIGEDPSDPVALWHKMFEATDYLGRRGLTMHAIGGSTGTLDCAGRSKGSPSTLLLRGQARPPAAYGTIYPWLRQKGSSRPNRGRQARNLRNFKFAADHGGSTTLRTPGAAVGARKQAGDQALLIVDAALSYRTLQKACVSTLSIVTGIWFLEAPLPLDDVEGHLEMSRHGLASASAISDSHMCASSLR